LNQTQVKWKKKWFFILKNRSFYPKKQINYDKITFYTFNCLWKFHSWIPQLWWPKNHSTKDQTPNSPALIAECSHFMEFRPRNYIAENQSHALPRLRADAHPLSPPPQPLAQVLPISPCSITIMFIQFHRFVIWFCWVWFLDSSFYWSKISKYLKNVYSMFLNPVI
jgi:hypothetical protein